MRFSIRDLVWVTFLCAVVSAWHIDHKALTNETDAKSRQWRKALDEQTVKSAVDREMLKAELLIEQKKVVALQDLRAAQATQPPAN
jgi:hypothetical protein